MNMPRIIDAHINAASVNFIPRKFIQDTANNMYSRMKIYNPSLNRGRFDKVVFDIYTDDMADRLVSEMDESGIESAILLAPDFTHVTECEKSYTEVMELHAEIARRHQGRFHVFFGADPRNGSQGVESFRKAMKDFGFSGLKLYPPAGYSPSDDAFDGYYRVCAEFGAPVLSHTGPGWHSLDFNLGHPAKLDKAIRRFPEVNFILGHGGICHVDDAVYLCTYRENAYMDISGFTAVNSPDGWAAHLNRLFRMGINHKIVFGTSWPAFKMSSTMKKIVGYFSYDGEVFSGIKKKDVDLIMSGNISRILKGVEV